MAMLCMFITNKMSNNNFGNVRVAFCITDMPPVTYRTKTNLLTLMKEILISNILIYPNFFTDVQIYAC